MIDPGNSQENKKMDDVAVTEQLESPQEQKQVLAQATDNEAEQEASGEHQDAATDEVTAGPSVQRGKKRVKKVRQVTEAELMSHPSIWPLALALSMAVALGGFAFNLVILGIGVIMVFASVIGWNLERR